MKQNLWHGVLQAVSEKLDTMVEDKVALADYLGNTYQDIDQNQQ